MKKILVLGSSGLLGSELTSGKYLEKYKIISQSLRSETDFNLDLENYYELIKMFEKVNPDIVINLVGFTDVDYCEKFPKKAYRLNAKTVENLVYAIKECHSKSYLVHISTDQVYDSSGYCSEKNIRLSNYYSFSKYIGELIASRTSSTILRTNFFGRSKTANRSSLTDWLYYELKNGNTINLFEDVCFNPISMQNFCKIIESVVEKKIQGIFNLGSNDGMSKADFAFNFAKFMNFSTSNMKCIKVSEANFLNAYRPSNMIMNLTKFEHRFKIKLPKLINEIELVSKEYL
jgi:dTDP-4-dehydrorhamnose reductase